MKEFKNTLIFIAIAVSSILSIVMMLGSGFSIAAHLGWIHLYRVTYNMFDLVSFLIISLSNIIFSINYLRNHNW